MKILVIGASSFTGSHFCEYARKQGAEVVEASLREDFPICGPDYAVNFAAANVVAPSWDYPNTYMQTNMQIRLWTYLLNINIQKYIHISTPEVYGNTTGFVRENAPYNPSTPYAVSRAAAEMMLKCYHKQYGFPVVFTRSCNVYGPGQQLYRLIPKLIVSIKKGIKFPLEGNGSSSRSFIHVNDACDGIWRVMTAGTTGEAYHMGGPTAINIRGLALMICEQMGVNLKDVSEEVPDRPGKDAGYFLNDDKIRALGWKNTIGLHAGIKDTINWVNDNWDTLKDQSLDYVHRP